MGNKNKNTSRPKPTPRNKTAAEKAIEKQVNEAFRRNISVLKKALANKLATLEDHDLSEPWASRRIRATCKYYQSAVDRYSAQYSDMEVAETFLTLCTVSKDIYDSGEQISHFTLGAALWILDSLVEANNFSEALKILPASVDFDTIRAPYFSDVCHSENVVASVLYLIQHKNDETNKAYRNKSKFFHERYICDYAAATGKTDTELHRKYTQLLELIPIEKRQSAIQHFKEKCIEWADILFHEAYELDIAQRVCGKKLNELNDKIESCYKESGITAQKRIQSNLSAPPFRATALNVLSNPSAPAQSAFTAMSSSRSRALALLSEFEALSAENDAACDRQFDLLYCAPESKTIRHDKLSECIGENAAAALRKFDVDDPYEICFALFYLIELDDDIPWLYGIPMAVLNAAAAKLPWEYDEYYEAFDPVWHPERDDRRRVRPSESRDGKISNDWYNIKYLSDFISDYDDSIDIPSDDRNLVQIVYEKTGIIMPRKLERYETIRRDLRKSKLTQGQITGLLPLLSVLGEQQHQTRPEIDLSLFEDMPPHVTEETADASSIEEKELEIKKLRSEIKQLSHSLHDAHKELREVKEKLNEKTEQMSSEHQELADLRELIFNKEEDVYTSENVEDDIVFPYKATHRIVVFGGHDTWVKEIKPKLPDVRFIDRGAIPNTEMIRRADIVWIQTNAIPHMFYNIIIEQVRKHNIPVRYFTYASAAKCAEQLVREDMIGL